MKYGKDFWNERYSEEEYIYGKGPNQFFKEQIEKLKPSKILFPCDGEGRNSVFAAKLGWKVDAFDQSDVAKDKALKLAEENNVEINYKVSSVLDFESEDKYDVIVLIYAHFDKEVRGKIHKHLLKFLKSNGKIILEAFNKKQIQNNSGGPKNESALYSKEELRNDFSDCNIEYLEEFEIILEESDMHQGKADVIRFVGVKR